MDCTPKILRHCGICCIALAVGTSGWGQTVVGIPATIVTATGRTLVTPFTDAVAPVAIAASDRTDIASWVVPSRFGISQLRTVHGQACYQTDAWSGALIVGALGMERYTEISIAAAGAVALSDALAAGVTLSYTFARARGFAAEHLMTVNAQMVFALDTLTAIAAAGINVGQAERAASSAGALSQFRLGISRTLGDGLAIDTDVALPLRLPAGFAVALRWDALDILRFRIAYCTVPHSAEVSIGLDASSSLALFATIHYHLSLGASPTIGIGYRW